MRRGSRCNVDQDDCGGLLRLKSRNHEPLVKFTVSSQSASSFINTFNLLLSWWDGWMISKWKIQNRETSLVFIHAYYNVRLYLLMFPRKGRNWSHCNGLIFTNACGLMLLAYISHSATTKCHECWKSNGSRGQFQFDDFISGTMLISARVACFDLSTKRCQRWEAGGGGASGDS